MTRGDDSFDPTLAPDLASDDTLAATSNSAATGGGRARKPTLSGYEVGEVLGEGGMGEVRLARDARIGRDVALKHMRHAEPSAEAVSRFLREAHIQARLDHPAIVPVHELGEDAEGRPYFTMKRIPSETLHDVLKRGDAPKARLLRAFVDICQAIEFAHARGFVHRDLKPTNVSLGDYGEVYVLDWGVARQLGDADAVPIADRIPSLDGATQAGALLGTPGYMAPEQALGEKVGTPADVYSLGCMLFEILAGAPLHPRGTHEAIASTIATPARSPAEVSPARAIPPELDAACTAALSADAGQRPTARELADRVQAYLDGDRDVERRRQLATDELAAARTALVGPAGRADAIRRAGRALVLDPESPDAAAFVLQLLVEPPKQLPAELERELDAQQVELYATGAQSGFFGVFAYVTMLPLLLWLGVRSWLVFGVLCGAIALLLALTAYQARTRKMWVIAELVVNIVQMVPISLLFGPFVMVPAVSCVFAMTEMTSVGNRVRPSVIAVGCLLAFLLPVALQALGWIPAVWTVEDGRIVLHMAAVHFGGPATMATLIGVNTGTIVVACVFSRALARSRDTAHRQLEIQAWHLRQLLPVATPRPPVPTC